MSGVSPTLTALIVLALAALLGSIPFGVLVARLFTGTDVRRVGSGNIGATNVLRASGTMAGLLTLALDMGKGAAAVGLARWIAASHETSGPIVHGSQVGTLAVTVTFLGFTLEEGAALAAVAAHMFTPWLGFKGGKGVATAAGALLVLSPTLAVAGLAVFAAVVAVTRIVSLASIVSCLALAVIAVVRPWPGLPDALPIVVISALVLLRHRENIARLLRREEPRLGARKRGVDGRGAGASQG